MRLKSRLKDSTSILIIIISFLSISIFLPIYDSTNGFHNLIFDDYKLTWYDGRSPINFYLIKNLIENHSASFQKGYKLGEMFVENFYDLIEKNNNYYPRYNIYGNYIYAAILYFINYQSDLQLFKNMLMLNMLFYVIILVLFYFVQKTLNLEIKYRLLSTFTAGVATSPLIYSRYFFISDTIITLVFLLLIYQILKNWKKLSLKNNIIIIVILLTFVSFIIDLSTFDSVFRALVFLLIFSYILIHYKLVNSKIYLPLLITIVTIILIGTSPLLSRFFSRPYGFPKKFPNFIHALDYIIYGFHDLSVWKLNRTSGFFYIFLEPPGNAIFMRFYSFFGSLFGAKGIIYNSPFLIFSILGIFCKRTEQETFILILTVLLICGVGSMLMWYGGVTPRYNRFLTIPALFLTFFSFYYIQRLSKEKSKFKRLVIYSIFVTLVILSILNVISLTVRADWTYEHEADLVSYDLVLWPWYPPKQQENVINLYLTEQGESVEWKFEGEVEGCKPYGKLEGIVTPVCDCEFVTYAERNIEIPWEKIRINITACSRNGDAIGKFYFDRIVKETLIKSDSCKTESMLIENSEGQHIMVLKPKMYNACKDGTIVWKLITIEKI
jgi:hypothetical protein